MADRSAALSACSRWAFLLVTLSMAAGCAEPDLTCSPPPGSLATVGDFSVDFVGETASMTSDTMHVRVTPKDAGAIELWACQERGDQMWIVELRVTRPDATTLPAAFAVSSTAPRVSAHLSRYDQYQLLEDQLGDGLSAQVGGSLLSFDDTQGVLSFGAQLSEPCAPVRCQADDRTLTLDADLTWEVP